MKPAVRRCFVLLIASLLPASIPAAALGQTLTVYGTAPGQAGPDYAGGVIGVGDTVRLDDGATVTGGITNSGTLQFNQTSGSLALTGSYVGNATALLSLTNSGTVGLLQSSTAVYIDGAVNVQAGRLTTGTAALFVGSTGTGSLTISGNGYVSTTFAQFASGANSTASLTITGGTFTNTALTVPPFYFASGSASSGTFTMTGGTASLGAGSGGGFAYGANSTATMLLTGGTMSWSWIEPAEGDNSTATITIGGTGTRLISSQYIRMSLGTNSVSSMTVNDGVVSANTLRMGSGVNSVSTFTVTGGSVGFDGTGATINGNFIGARAGSSGTMTFTGGTTTFAGPTLVGGLGTVNGGGASRGMFRMDGGLITSNTAASGLFSNVNENHFILGRYAPTIGEMVVTSGTFIGQRDFYVGGSGTGSLTLSGSGGLVQVARLFISATANSQMNSVGGAGTVTVSSGTLLSTGSATIGNTTSGTGSLTINGSGVVIVGGTLARGAVGAINLQAGGTLQIGTGSTGGVLLGGTGSLRNDGTLVFNRSNALTHAGLISGTGGLVKRGTGALTLSASNSYSGLTTVSSGTLALSGSGAIGSGGLTLAAGSTFDLASLTDASYVLPTTGDLAGSGLLAGAGKALSVLGEFRPGSSPGTITLASGFTLDLSASEGSVFELTDPSYSAGTFDLVDGAGNVILGGRLSLVFTNGSYANGTNVVRLFANTGSISGIFSSVEATGLEAGQSVTFDAATGYVSIVPEPSALAALGTAAATLLARAWRRNAGPRRRPAGSR